jgi:signal transduction histidine kinase
VAVCDSRIAVISAVAVKASGGWIEEFRGRKRITLSGAVENGAATGNEYLPISEQRADLRKLVEEVLHELEAETANRNIEWRIEGLPVVECDPGLIKQALSNLLSNAIKYTRPRAPAIIEVRKMIIDGQRTFLVRDNGVGFDLKKAQNLF